MSFLSQHWPAPAEIFPHQGHFSGKTLTSSGWQSPALLLPRCMWAEHHQRSAPAPSLGPSHLLPCLLRWVLLHEPSYKGKIYQPLNCHNFSLLAFARQESNVIWIERSAGIFYINGAYYRRNQQSLQVCNMRSSSFPFSFLFCSKCELLYCLPQRKTIYDH